MRMMRIVAAIILGITLLLPALAAAAALKPGSPAPDFEMAVLGSDKPFKMADIRGKKALVMGVTQSACASCVAELKYLNNFVGISPNVDVYAISVDFKAGEEQWVKNKTASMQQEGLKMPMMMDPKYTLPRQFGVRATPGMIFIDKAGNLVKAITGFDDEDRAEIKALFEQLSK